MRTKTFLQEIVEVAESAIAAFDRAFLRLNFIKPLDETEDSTASEKPADKE